VGDRVGTNSSWLAGVVLGPIRVLNALVRRLSAATHWLQYKAEGALQGDAEWFDHEIDVHWQWPRRGRSEFLERGVLSAVPMRPTDRVLELCSGDGFFAQRCFAPRVAGVLGLDHNPRAVRFARRAHAADNVRYEVADIAADLPEGPFERVVWNAALTHFSDAEIAFILSATAAAMTRDGVLTGLADIERRNPYGYTKTSLDGPADLAAYLTPHFAHVAILETSESERSNLYFFASDDRDAILVSERHPAVTYWAGRQPTSRFARSTAVVAEPVVDEPV
jgi:Methyltransferase domain